MDLAITNAPDLFSLSIDNFLAVSDHSSLTVKYHDPAAPQPRWCLKDIDWDQYAYACQLSFTAIANKQSVLDSIVNLFTNTLNSTASGVVRRSRRRDPDSSKEDEAKLADLLGIYRRSQSTAVHETTPHADAHSHLHLKVLVAKKHWEDTSAGIAQRGWSNLCSSIQGKRAAVVWRQWKQSQCGHAPQITPLPRTLKEFCQNVADFYADVMSTRPIPSWSSNAPACTHPPTLRLDEEIRQANEEGVERVACWMRRLLWRR